MASPYEERATALAVLQQILEQLRLINERLGSSATSSVEIRTSTRGTDISVKAYLGSGPIQDAGDAAMGEYLRCFDDLEAELLGRRQRA